MWTVSGLRTRLPPQFIPAGTLRRRLLMYPAAKSVNQNFDGRSQGPVVPPDLARTTSSTFRIALRCVLSRRTPVVNHVVEGILGCGCRPAAAKKDLPPLPEIKNGNIRLQVFTHRSFYARQTRLFEDHPGMDERHVNAPVQASRLF